MNSINPGFIPWLFCGVLCIGPVLIGTVSYFAWGLFTGRSPSRDVSHWEDDDGRKHTTTEWVMLSREEKKLRNRKEEEEE